MITGIVAVDRNGAIGKGGKLPWHYPTDLRFFKQTTIHHACVMGRHTWLSLKKPLPDRLNIVLSRQSAIAPQDSVVSLRDASSVLAIAKYLNCDLFVIGGAKVYETFLPNIEKWIVTKVPLTIADADAFVPSNYLEGFQQTSSQPLDEGLVVEVYQRTGSTRR